ncbi:dihydroneopterin aldolase [Prochlorococcus marinus]|uniref:dihydroneopterin aldolase n=1 Tax=Prochlorococcus marinus TaxID=1219 RepID=UPI0022B4710D|nr:dihydroneopterin aldolase [Prochlorococcus marinus]
MESSIQVDGLNLWAHVGVLEEERLLGQRFLLDFIIWIDVENAVKGDNLINTVDYSLAVQKIQQLALDINCMTIEYFSEQILNQIENIYGSVPIQITLQKCFPPIHGFSGSVSIRRTRNFKCD